MYAYELEFDRTRIEDVREAAHERALDMQNPHYFFLRQNFTVIDHTNHLSPDGSFYEGQVQAETNLESDEIDEDVLQEGLDIGFFPFNGDDGCISEFWTDGTPEGKNIVYILYLAQNPAFPDMHEAF